jgi:hypothetical protein
MFASPVQTRAKAVAGPSNGSAGQRPMFAQHRIGHAAGELRAPPSTQYKPGSARSPAPATQGLATNERGNPDVRNDESHGGRVPGRALSWNLGKISILPPVGADRPTIGNVPVSQPGDPLELNADAVATRLLVHMGRRDGSLSIAGCSPEEIALHGAGESNGLERHGPQRSSISSGCAFRISN